MANLIDFDAWLATLPALGYDRHWIRRNRAALHKRFVATDGAAYPPCPEAPDALRDRYEELT
jgi:hypothetical protein